MNLPQYHEAMLRATSRFQETMAKARQVLDEDIAKASRAFLHGEDEVMLAERDSLDRDLAERAYQERHGSEPRDPIEDAAGMLARETLRQPRPYGRN